MARTLDALIPFLAFCEVIVIDDGSSDGTSELIKSRYAFVKLVRNDANKGSAACWNIGIKQANHESVFFLADDTILNTSPEVFTKYIPSERSKLVIGVRIEGNFSHPTGYSLPDRVKCFLYHLCGLVYSENANLEKEVPFVWGCMITSKSLAQEILFDESFEGNAFREETDFQLRARKVGCKILYTPNIILLHEQERTGGQYQRTANRSDYWIQRNQMIFLKTLQTLVCKGAYFFIALLNCETRSHASYYWFS